ncbi:unnamed protein product (mitochondrion) [Plasmodiophora brassicae]|uniref:inosine/xanthosine triphosphatase n=1 Tax=Plasmodiophora brassicae TaxID=37360 RepID=A0A0G4IX40_PLABS|nr:hypothetical protein PBRA_007634 [Plasmodiophora brassicae]SPQ99532.1 unnamed protein product [Plasmodiophora brassicae]
MDRTKRVVVGSKNPAKIRAVQIGLEAVLPGKKFDVVGAGVSSGVKAQPMTMQETSDGSKNRAIAAMASDGAAEFGVGLEGGIEEGPDGKHFESGWCTVVDRGGRIGQASTARMQVSGSVLERINAGEELGDIVDDLSLQTDVRSGQGFMGLITNGGLPRDACYSHAVMLAFAPFVSNPVFWRE